MSSSDSELLNSPDGRPYFFCIPGRRTTKRRSRSRLLPVPDKKKLRERGEFRASSATPSCCVIPNRQVLQRIRAQSVPPQVEPCAPLPDYEDSLSSAPTPLDSPHSPSPQPIANPPAPSPQPQPIANSPAPSPQPQPVANPPAPSPQPQRIDDPTTPSPQPNDDSIADPQYPVIEAPIEIQINCIQAQAGNNIHANPFLAMENAAADRLEAAFDKLCLAPYASKLPTFYGDKSGAGFMDFIAQFNEIGNIMGLNESQMVRLLPVHLKGEAKAVFENFSDEEKQNWRMAVTSLKNHFSSEHFLDVARERIITMRMEPGESPILFSNRLRKEIMDAYPSVNLAEQRKFLQNMVFTNALPNSIKQKLKILGPLPTDHDKLVREAERMFDIEKTDSQHQGEHRLIAIIDKVIDTLVSKRNYEFSPNFNRNSPRNHNPNFQYKKRYNKSSFKNSNRPPSRSRTPPRNSVRFAPNSQNSYIRDRKPYFNRNRSPNRSQNRSNNQSNRPNFNRNQQRPRSPFRRQAQTPPRYQVNSIHRVPSVVSLQPTTSLFLVAIFSIFIIPTDAMSLKYQLCAAGKSGWPIAFPDPIKCTSSPNASELLITEAELYVEQTEPLLITAFHCFNKTRKICASSYLHVTFSVDSDEEFMTPVDPALCKSLTETRKFMGVPLEQFSPNTYGSENQIHYSYPWFFGEKCTVTTNVYFEKGVIATFDGDHVIGQFGDMAHCTMGRTQCIPTHGTVIWTRPQLLSRLCRYVKAANGVAYVTPTHIVLSNIQSAFTYKNVTFAPSKLYSWCLSQHAIPMDNGVFIVLPEIAGYNPRTLFSAHSDVVESINQKHFYNSQFVHFAKTVSQSSRMYRATPNATHNATSTDSTPPEALPFNLGILHKFIHSLQKKSLDSKRFTFGVRSRARRVRDISLNNHNILDTLLRATKSPEIFIPIETTTQAPVNISAQIAHHIALNSEPDFETMIDDSSISHEERQDSRQAELNTKLQFLKFKMDEVVKQDYNYLLDRICSLMNFKIQSIKSIAQINPTSAARMLLNREDIFALSAGDVLMVSKCREIIIDEIILDHNIKGTCYVFTPVRSGKTHYFIQPGTRDLVKDSPEADCGHLPFGIYNDGYNHYKSPSGYAQVTNIHFI